MRIISELERLISKHKRSRRRGTAKRSKAKRGTARRKATGEFKRKRKR